jgi:hypothetical protein
MSAAPKRKMAEAKDPSRKYFTAASVARALVRRYATRE